MVRENLQRNKSHRIWLRSFFCVVMVVFVCIQSPSTVSQDSVSQPQADGTTAETKLLGEPQEIRSNRNSAEADLRTVAFIEVISESSDHPPEDAWTEVQTADNELVGYVFEAATDTLPATLYPALGEEPNQKNQLAKYWIGFRIIDSATYGPEDMSDTPYSFKQLVSVSGDKATFDGESVPRERLRESGAYYAADRPRVELEMEATERGFVIKTGDQQFNLQPGTWRVVHDQADESTKWPSYHRLSVRLHERIRVSDFDALHQWKLSKQLMLSGPYKEALAATERVLLASPANELALRRWSEVNRLISAGKVPSSLEVTFRFPNENDVANHLKKWSDDSGALIYLSRPESPPEVAVYGAEVNAKSVRIAAPSGTYRVKATLPGFREIRQEIEINGKTNLVFELEIEP